MKVRKAPNPARAFDAVSLAPDAYVRALDLYQETGDIRYLVIFLGQPKSSFYNDEWHVPKWAIDEFKNYAEAIYQLPPKEREKLTSSSAYVSVADENGSLLIEPIHSDRERKQFAEIFQYTQSNKYDPSTETFNDVCRRHGVDEDQIRKFRNWYKDEVGQFPFDKELSVHNAPFNEQYLVDRVRRRPKTGKSRKK